MSCWARAAGPGSIAALMTTHRLGLLLGAALLAAACAPRPLTPLATDPRPFGPTWSAPLHRDHPLAGRILDVKGRRWIDQATLDAALVRADVAVLGEVHDNPDSHLLQAREIRAVTAAGKSPVLAFEMINPSQQAAVDAVLASGAATADAIGEALEWSKSTWPAFAMYRPVFQAGLDAKLPFQAANLSRTTAREMMKKGAEALDEDVRAWVARAPELTPAELETMGQEMAKDHCGELPGDMLKPLVLMQRARDAQLAAREAKGRTVVALAHLEVQPEFKHPDDYAAEYGGTLPYDFVIFTPAAEREDPCVKLHRQLEEKKKPAAPAKP